MQLGEPNETRSKDQVLVNKKIPFEKRENGPARVSRMITQKPEPKKPKGVTEEH